jgi:hypothetical protein
VTRPEELSNQQARWLAIAAQGLAAPRGHDARRRPGRAALEAVMQRVGTIQLDAVNVLERTQFLVPFSRMGAYDRDTMRRLTGPQRPWFEYWGHAASLLPVAMYPLLRPRMGRFSANPADGSPYERRRAAWRAEHAAYLGAVLRDVAERGPLAASQLADPRRRAGEWWERRSDGRRALEVLFGEGVLAAWRNPTFERVYDLTERVIPREALEAPVPAPEEAERQLIVIAAGCMGVASSADLADYFGLKRPTARLRIAELVDDGRLTPLRVQGWKDPAYIAADARPRAPRRVGATLLSPFDSLIWSRDRTERLFGFRYRIEIYVPEPRRIHGYYVLPLLLGDRLVGRFDLKADRKTSTLVVGAAHAEPDADRSSIVDGALGELSALARWLGLEQIAVGGRGALAGPLHAALAKAQP